jgi:hypothetical protein
MVDDCIKVVSGTIRGAQPIILETCWKNIPTCTNFGPRGYRAGYPVPSVEFLVSTIQLGPTYVHVIYRDAG